MLHIDVKKASTLFLESVVEEINKELEERELASPRAWVVVDSKGVLISTKVHTTWASLCDDWPTVKETHPKRPKRNEIVSIKGLYGDNVYRTYELEVK